MDWFVPAVIFLAVIVLILIGLLGTYYCLIKELCPCSKMEPVSRKDTGYEELGEEPPQEEVETSEDDDDELVSPEDKKDGGDKGERLDPEKLPIFQTDEDVQKSISAYGDVQVDTGLKEVDRVPVFGSVHLEVEYSANVGRLTVNILDARDIPSKSRGGSSQCRFHLLLLPVKKQRFKSKTRSTVNPKFDEKFVFDRILQQDLFRMAVRIRLYGHDKLSKEKLIGEHIFQLADVAQSRNNRMNVWRDLKAHLPDDTSP